MKLIALTLLTITTLAHGMTFKEWKKFDDEQKTEYLSNEYGEVEVDLVKLTITSQKMTAARASKLKSKISNLVKQMAALKTELNTEVEDNYHFTVGSIEKTALIHFSSDNKFIGASIYYFQRGCSQEEESGHYTTMAEAKKNGCIDNDVSWSGNSIVNEALKEIYQSDYMEWSGH